MATVHNDLGLRRVGVGKHVADPTDDQVCARSRSELHADEESICSNYKQRSLYGFRLSALIGWVGGDSFK